MNSENLLDETLSVLTKNGKTKSDVLWVGSPEIKISWDNFEKLANIEYDNGFGSAKVAIDLLIVGDDWWMERDEYDGSEWWLFKTKPKEPKELVEVFTLIAGQGDAINFLGDETLVQLNTPYSDEDND